MAQSLVFPSRCVLPLVLASVVGLVGSTRADEEPVFNPKVEGGATTTFAEEPEDLPAVEIDFRDGTVEEVAQRVLAVMSLREKIGQLCQVAGYGDETPNDLRAGRIGSLFYTGNAEQTREAKRIVREESRLGLPLLTPRDVIHGFRTVFPIPVAQAASWDPDLIEAATAIAAEESLAEGVNWTFAPMLDVCRDARWGRIAESVGEDPYLGATIAKAMVNGYQQPTEAVDGSVTYQGIAACAKHFAAYGLSEGGRDYNRAQVAKGELHSAILPPFKAAIDAGCATVMTGFSTINGIPGTGHRELITEVLKQGWDFDGLVVSDWASVVEMVAHGFAADRRDAARLALLAGVDMEMATTTFQDHLLTLLESGEISTEALDDAVMRVLRIKLRFALHDERDLPQGGAPTEARLAIARVLAQQSCVLLKNDSAVLPLDAGALKRVAVIGPLANAARDQLGCWMLDGKAEEAITPLTAIQEALSGKAEVTFAPALASSIDESTDGIAAAVEAVSDADIAIVCVGEGWQLSGEARCRADINLPGAQGDLVKAIAETGKPMVLVVLAGRPLTIGEELDLADAVLYAWHPGTMGGPAIADLLLGVASPSGKLPVTFPKHVGQSPLYYNHPRTGRPALRETTALIGSGRADFPEKQKYRSHYLDVDPFPLLPFGHGLSYTTFEYGTPELTTQALERGQTLGVRVTLKNTGDVAAAEVTQLYVQDVAASLVRPVRELKRFRRVMLEPGEEVTLEFALSTDDLAYHNNEGKLVTEPGDFLLGVGGDSTVPMEHRFSLREPALAEDASSRPLR